ncbi:MAG: hypothetical protein KKG69_03755 [Alphaproteobacteria bacterium]|uniref:hypothetical protein n=1 Tax=Brevundimonas sp. TaxID=1871086 RepID=UPI00120F8CE4|nr:hypothetical protein [Alphaproteobacteria bacterium]MBU2163932.1 hypothetical protein [Alphaproteobacteria bacterium]MBU2230370.1 hypothetical protein [Alphaproteobacteria bacterium]TAJ40635.1 MAG: hypothetical protein EPO54_11830 [Brevundimonas sp.]
MSEPAHTPRWPTAEAVLADPSASFALKAVVRDWAALDPVDAANDAAILQAVCHGAVLAAMGFRK